MICRLRRSSFAGALLVVAAACAQRQVEVTSDNSAVTNRNVSMLGVRWSTTLMPMSGTSVSGTASVHGTSTPGQGMAMIRITGAPANGVHPWHVHTGRCGDANMGTIIGGAENYSPLTADASGGASGTAIISASVPASGDYRVHVHRSPDDMGTVVACGQLAVTR